jgi:hypothetical protein
LLLFFGNYTSGYAQNAADKTNKRKSLHDVAFNHRQVFNNSCIPMSVEMVLKYNSRVKPDYNALQNTWQDKSDGTFKDFDGKTYFTSFWV